MEVEQTCTKFQKKQKAKCSSLREHENWIAHCMMDISTLFSLVFPGSDCPNEGLKVW